MCGIVGYSDLRRQRPAEREVLARMSGMLVHRGPDSEGYFVEGSVGLGFRRLSIVDPAGGDQPMHNEDGSLVLLCNGEIYNHQELRRELAGKGHVFRSRCDVEVALHLYEEEGSGLLDRLDGQFALVLYDRRSGDLLLARDPFGICPLHYGVFGGSLLFGSEIKAILAHPLATREVDLTGLDQVFCFPGLVSPRTLFKNVCSLPPGHALSLRGGELACREYWDLDYPRLGEVVYEGCERDYVAGLAERFQTAVARRLQGDVPVGFYLSGGLDSSLIAATIGQVSPGVGRHSLSITFPDAERDEAPFQRLMARQVGSEHHEILFEWPQIAERLEAMVWHAECPVKESYNTCSLALSAAARAAGLKVILTGEGADELFAGYVGYRFDRFDPTGRGAGGDPLDVLLGEEIRERLWGDRHLFYEQEGAPLGEAKAALYAPALRERLPEFDCFCQPLVNPERLRGRHPLHQRSYLDCKLRLGDHLLGDHGDRMALANSVEARYPFLDRELVDFAVRMPPELKLHGFTEKYALRRMAAGRVPEAILEREKFGFHAPGSPYLLRGGGAWLEDLLSCQRIERQAYFDPQAVERLKRRYLKEGFRLNLPFESDLLMVVLTFGILLDAFDLPAAS